MMIIPYRRRCQLAEMWRVASFGVLLVAATSNCARSQQVDLDMQHATINAFTGGSARGGIVEPGAIVQKNKYFSLDSKNTLPFDVDLKKSAPRACQHREPMVMYELRPASQGYRETTQKIMHRLYDKPSDRVSNNQIVRTVFEVVFPKEDFLNVINYNERVMFFQLWQGAPFRPPLAVSIVGGDAKNVRISLHINDVNWLNKRLKLALISLPRDTCIRFDINNTIRLGKRGAVKIDIQSLPPIGRPNIFYSGDWRVKYGYDLKGDERQVHQQICRIGPKLKCCVDRSRFCKPNSRLQTLFGLYRPTSDNISRIFIGNVQQSKYDAE